MRQPVLCTWLSQGAKHSVFLQTTHIWSIEAFFVIFMIDSTQTLFLYRVLLALIFCLIACSCCLYLKPHPHLNIWITCSHWSVFEFLARDFPKISCTEYTVHLGMGAEWDKKPHMLSSFLYYILLMRSTYISLFLDSALMYKAIRPLQIGS